MNASRGSDLSLKKLSYFVTVAEELHFGRAASRLHIAQPALSQQIQRLEADVGALLFERTTRRVALTTAGRVLLEQARRLLVTADGVERAIRELRDGERGVLRVGFVDSAAYELVPRFLRECRTWRPNVDFELRSMSTDEQVKALSDGRIDLGIGRTAGAASGLEVRLLGAEPLVLAVAVEHELAGASDVSLVDLAAESFIGFDREVSPTLHAELRLMMAKADVGYGTTMEATEYTTILGLVAAGVGVALVPASVQTFRPPGLTFVPIADSVAAVQLVVLSRPNEPLAVVGRAIEIVAALVASGVGGFTATNASQIHRRTSDV